VAYNGLHCISGLGALRVGVRVIGTVRHE
jgi:hypothetical protein